MIAGDDDVDRAYQRIEGRVVELVARYQPVASDLRFLISVIHVALHLERIADMAVNVAQSTQAASGLPTSPQILERLARMGERTAAMVDLAVEAFTRRDRELCEPLGALDDPIDQLNRELVGLIAAYDGDETQLEWAIRMLQVSRYLERAAEYAVDIGEQAWFLITGELRELD